MIKARYGCRKFLCMPGQTKSIALAPLIFALAALLCCAAPVHGSAGAVHRDVPSVIDPDAKYLFYLHGQAIERGGRHARSYDYQGILGVLADRGFVVIGEERSATNNRSYAKKIVGQVQKLLSAGAAARNITVAGHSKGGMITLMVMSRLGEPDIAYVNFAGCGMEGGSRSDGIARFAEEDASKARGRLLSAYERGDTIAGSCKAAIEKMSDAFVQERVLDFGGGHELFYRPDNAWIDILQAWAERRGHKE